MTFCLIELDILKGRSKHRNVSL